MKYQIHFSDHTKKIVEVKSEKDFEKALKAAHAAAKKAKRSLISFTLINE
jgi:hypothetical protein